MYGFNGIFLGGKLPNNVENRTKLEKIPILLFHFTARKRGMKVIQYIPYHGTGSETLRKLRSNVVIYPQSCPGPNAYSNGEVTDLVAYLEKKKLVIWIEGFI